MKNILLVSSAALVLSVITLIPVSAMESSAAENELALFQYSIEQDFYLIDYMDDIALYDENDEADYTALEAEEEYGEMICVLYDENDEEDYALLESIDQEVFALYDENDEADFLALENMQFEEYELYQNNDIEESDYLAMN